LTINLGTANSMLCSRKAALGRIMGADISFDTSMNFALLMAASIGLMILVGRIAERRGRRFTTWASIAAIIGPFALPLVFLFPNLHGKNGDHA
jgi:MFS family permease